jgi:hypothetical protein
MLVGTYKAPLAVLSVTGDTSARGKRGSLGNNDSMAHELELFQPYPAFAVVASRSRARRRPSIQHLNNETNNQVLSTLTKP